MNEATESLRADTIRVPRHRRNWYVRVENWRYQTISFAPRSKTTLAAFLRTWHQRAGLFACLFMAWLGASGFVLNQSASWGLDAVRAKSPWLMSMYGLYPQPPEAGFLAGENWLAQTSEKTVVNGNALLETVPSPIGLATYGSGNAELLFIAASDRLVITTPDGGRVDELRGYTLPVSAIRRIGTSSDGAVAIQDLDVFVTRDGLSWEEVPVNTGIRWSKPERLSADVKTLTLPFARPTMPVEQVLIDAHSGRLFGRYGPWFVNAVGFAAVFLGLSGAWMFISTARRRRKRSR